VLPPVVIPLPFFGAAGSLLSFKVPVVFTLFLGQSSFRYMRTTFLFPSTKRLLFPRRIDRLVVFMGLLAIYTSVHFFFFDLILRTLPLT